MIQSFARSDLLLNLSQSLVDKSLTLYAHDLFTLTIDLQPVIYQATNHYEHKTYFLNKTLSVGINFLNHISSKSLEIKLSGFTEFFTFSSPAGRQTHNAMTLTTETDF